MKADDASFLTGQGSTIVATGMQALLLAPGYTEVLVGHQTQRALTIGNEFVRCVLKRTHACRCLYLADALNMGMKMHMLEDALLGIGGVWFRTQNLCAGFRSPA